MIITYLGKQFFKIQQGEKVIAINPVSKDSKHSKYAAKFGADLVLSSLNHPDFNGFDNLHYGDRSPFIIDGPGDYEVGGVFVRGLYSEAKIGGKKYTNTIYCMEVEGISLCFLGALSDANLSAEAREIIDSPDILILPIGGGDTLGPAEAYKLSTLLEPKIIIPMDYDADEKNLVKTLSREAGEDKFESLDRLTLRKKDLEGKEGEIIFLNH